MHSSIGEVVSRRRCQSMEMASPLGACSLSHSISRPPQRLCSRRPQPPRELAPTLAAEPIGKDEEDSRSLHAVRGSMGKAMRPRG
jgi:hypothetical protein